MVELVKFSPIFRDIYDNLTNKSFLDNNCSREYFNCPANIDEAKKYLNLIFPRRAADAKCALKQICNFPPLQGTIAIIDIGCGPYTFTQALIDEIIIAAEYSPLSTYKIHVYGVDLSRQSLSIGNDMLNNWSDHLNQKRWTFDYQSLVDNVNFTGSPDVIRNWFNSLGNLDYIFIGFNACTSSGVECLNNIYERLKILIKTTPFYLIYTETTRNASFLNNLRCTSQNFFQENNISYNEIHGQFEKQCENFRTSEFRHDEIRAPFHAFVIDNLENHIVSNLLGEFQTSDISHVALYFNQGKFWQLRRHMVDILEMNIIESSLDILPNVLKISIPYCKKFHGMDYKIQKSLRLGEQRKMKYFPTSFTLFSILILMRIKDKISEILEFNGCETKSKIVGNRLTKKVRLNWIYEYFAKGYSKFVKFQTDQWNMLGNEVGSQLSFCQTDIVKFYHKIPINHLYEMLHRDFGDLSDLIIKCLGLSNLNNNYGIPVGSCLSPTLANYYLHFFDARINQNENILAFMRYVDDSKFIINFFPTPEIISQTQARLNEYLLPDFQTGEALAPLRIHIEDSKFHLYEFTANNLNYEEIENSRKYNEISEKIRSIVKKCIVTIANRFSQTTEHQVLTYPDMIAGDLDIWVKIFFNLGINIRKSRLTDIPYLISFKIRIDGRLMLEEQVIFGIENDIFLHESNQDQFDFLMNNIRNHEDNQVFLSDIENLTNEIYSKALESLEQLAIFLNFEGEGLSENVNFLKNFRKCKFYLYRLCIVLKQDLFNPDHEFWTKINLVRDLYIPIKLIALLHLTYRHYEKLRDLAIEGMRRSINKILRDRQIYPCDIAQILRLIYEAIQVNNNFDLIDPTFFDLIKEYIANGYPEEKLASTELIFLLNRANDIDYHIWTSWISRETNGFVLKNMILCLISHDHYSDDSILLIQQKISQCYSQNPCFFEILIKNWNSIRENLDRIRNPPRCIQYLQNNIENLEIDLDTEIRAILELDQAGDYYPF